MKHSSKKGLKQKDHSRVVTGSVSGSANGSGGSFKGKEASTRLSKPPDTPEECVLSFPDLRIVDNNKLHCYLSILNKSKEEMIGMDDLDNLQLELEILLSAVSVRIRDLQGEIVTLTNTDERAKDKKVKLAASKTVVKKDEKSAIKITKPVKDVKLPITTPLVPPVKAKSKSTSLGVEQDILPEHPLPEIAITTDQAKITVPKNDTPNKFWAYVEAYCAEITADDVKYLEDLIASCEKDSDIMKIPPLGKHYTLRWAEEDLAEERDSSSVNKLKRKSSDSANVASSNTGSSSGNNQSGNNNNNSTGASGPKELLKKAEKLCTKEQIPGPLAQRLISALLEEHINIAPLQESGNKLKVDKQNVADQDGESSAKRQKLDSCPTNVASHDSKTGENAIPNYVKKLPLYHTSVCFERRIRRGLETAGFIDSQPPQEENDEILKEIKKCQEELRNCALHNISQLKHVLKLAHAEVARNQVRKKLRQTDAEIVEIYRRMAAAKLKKKQISKKEREQAWKVLKDRESWLKHFESLPSGLLI